VRAGVLWASARKPSLSRIAGSSGVQPCASRSGTEVLDDHDEGTISNAELVEVVHLVESYVFRRAIAGIPTNILSKTFAALAREIDKANYMESLKAALLLPSPAGRR
jgi:hypothetical protein